MEITGDLDNMRVTGPTVSPYAATQRRCPACGQSRDGWFVALMRALRGKARRRVYSIAYCAGERPPEEPVQVFFFSGERKNTCFGITSRHLHVRCTRCGVEFFTETGTAA